jgi:hypothetical protein
MTPRAHPLPAASLFLALSLASSCGTDYACACSPPETPVGTYQATRLRFTPSGQATVDALAAGATITLTLLVGGTTTGTFVIPASLNNGVQETLDLTGTYQVTGGHITFSHGADTFLRDLDWSWDHNTLITTGSAGGVQFDVVLTRQ